MTLLNPLANLVPSFSILYCPQPLAASMLLYVSSHVSEIPECLSFCVWLISLNILTSNFINVSTNGKCLPFMWVKCSTVSMCLLFIRRNKLQAWHTLTQKSDHSSQHSTVVQHSWETGFGTFSLLRNDTFEVMDDAQSWMLHNEHRSQILTLYLINKCSYYIGLKRKIPAPEEVDKTLP